MLAISGPVTYSVIALLLQKQAVAGSSAQYNTECYCLFIDNLWSLIARPLFPRFQCKRLHVLKVITPCAKKQVRQLETKFLYT